MPTPLASDVHINKPLSNISIALIQDQSMFQTDSIFPNIPVQMQSDLFYTYDQGDFLRNEMEERAPGTETKGSGYKLGQDNYFCKVYGFHHDIDDQRRANQDSPLALDREAVTFVTDKANLFREANWCANFFSAGNWGTDATVATGWQDDASDPITDIEEIVTDMLEKTGKIANTMVLGRNVYNKLKNHPDVVDRIKAGQTSGIAITKHQQLAELFEMERIIVLNAIQNTAKEGATDVISFIANKHGCLICYSNRNPGLMTASAGYTFSWDGLYGASAYGSRIKKFRMEAIESDRIEIGMAYAVKQIAVDLGTYIPAATS
ncbi:MAG: hypothetical protein COB09_18535 [Thalassobium sp.]|nr:MAG: hypothetical protein COB09_18535 [Thalassobium sp.]